MRRLRFRLLAFRLLAVLVGLAVFPLVELLLGLLGVGDVVATEDPFLGLARPSPLFVLSADGERYEVSPGRREYFAAESFRARKEPGALRVFCLGGSTVQGRPWSIETSFTTWMEIALSEALSPRPVEVVNVGGVSYASYRLVPLLDEALGHSPDLIVVYTGQNEFLEDRSYHAAARDAPSWIRASYRLLSRSRLFRVLRHGWLALREELAAPAPAAPRAVLPAEVDALLDHEGGLEAYRRDPEWKRGVVEHFAFNLRALVARARAAGVSIVLCDPAVDLRDTPPFKAVLDERLDESERRRWSEVTREAAGLAARLERDAIAGALALFDVAATIDPGHAGVAYERGRLLETLGRLDEAREAFQLAVDLDVCPLRATREIRRVIATVAEELSVPLVPVATRLGALCSNGIAGAEALVDHVHPSVRSHQEIARWTLEALADAAILPSLSPATWERVGVRWEAHLETLSPHYFAQGEVRLRNLRQWAEGRVRPPRRE